MCKELFGVLGEKEIYSYTLQNSKLKVQILTYGAIIYKLFLLDKPSPLSVCTSYDSINKYAKNSKYYGATIGRYANRIKGGKFTLNGKDYKLTINDNGNSLHGGINGFNKQIFDVVNHTNNSITLYTKSLDMDEGFPGNLDVFVTFTINDSNLIIDYFAKCDSDTIINLTNHSYFNLGGEGQDGSDMLLQIDADYITETDEKLIPTGKFLQVKDTLYDFNLPRKFICDFAKDKTLSTRGCYDDNFVLRGSGLRKVASLFSPKTNTTMQIITDQKGMQVYSGDNNGIALETQNFPDSINHENFPSPILKKGEEYKTTTIYKFI